VELNAGIPALSSFLRKEQPKTAFSIYKSFNSASTPCFNLLKASSLNLPNCSPAKPSSFASFRISSPKVSLASSSFTNSANSLSAEFANSKISSMVLPYLRFRFSKKYSLASTASR